MRKRIELQLCLTEKLICTLFAAVMALLAIMICFSGMAYGKGGKDGSGQYRGGQHQGQVVNGAGNATSQKGAGKSTGSVETAVSSPDSSTHGSPGGTAGRGGKGNGQGRGGSAGNADVAADGGVKGRGSGKGGPEVTDSHTDSEDEDSDKPAWAGKDGDHSQIPGGGNHGKDTKKGDDYGDLFVMDRYDDGTLKMYDADGNLCEDSEGCFPAAVIPLADGTYEIFVLTGEVDPPETVMEVELGRLNISRAPEKVLQHALEEALSKLDGLELDLENFAAFTDYSGRLLSPETLLAIDSPLENLALFQAILEAYVDPETAVKIVVEGSSLTISGELIPQVAASLLAAASDKTHVIEVDEVMYLGTFLGVEGQLVNMVEDYASWYARETMYDVDISVLDMSQDPPAWDLDANLLTEVGFTPTEDFWVIDDDLDGIDFFTMAADDSLQVLEFVHDAIFQGGVGE